MGEKHNSCSLNLWLELSYNRMNIHTSVRNCKSGHEITFSVYVTLTYLIFINYTTYCIYTVNIYSTYLKEESLISCLPLLNLCFPSSLWQIADDNDLSSSNFDEHIRPLLPL